jgi:HEAT repeat protein
MSRITSLSLGWLLMVHSPARGSQLTPEDASFLLETDSDPSPEAILVLAEKGGGLGVSSLLRVMDRLGTEQRRIVAESFRGRDAEQQRVFDALFQLARDEAAPVREAAIDSLRRSKSSGGGLTLLRLIDAGHPDREALAKAVHRFANAHHEETDPAFRDFQERAVQSLEPLLTDSSTSVRRETVQALSYFSHPRAEDLLFSRFDDPDANTRHYAQTRVFPVERFLGALLDYARSLPASDERRERFSDVGNWHCRRELPRFFEMFRSARSPQEKDDYRSLLEGCGSEFEPEARAALTTYVKDPDPEIRDKASILLGWVEEAERKGSEPSTPLVFFLLTSALSALLGLIFFFWAFRLLKLRALLEGLGLSNAQSIALGTVAISGEAQPRGDYLKHPYTGELCVWYRGAPREHCFYLEDGTGRLLVDPHDAVLLSEDGLLSPGERIHIVATAKRNPDAPSTSSESLRVVLGKRDEVRPFHQRIVDLLVGGLLGVTAGNRSIRRLFDNPQDVFWIWDDARRRPMSSPREVALIFAVALFAGGWMVVFFVSTTAALGFDLLR